MACFERIADEWEAQLDAEAGHYAFNDFHAAMAFAACGRTKAMRTLGGALTHAACGRDSLADMARDVAIPLVRAVEAFTSGRYSEAIACIEPVRDIAHRFGGSHAQRDLITLTLIEAALRSRDASRARHYIAERQMLKSGPTQWGARLARRAQHAGVPLQEDPHSRAMA